MTAYGQGTPKRVYKALPVAMQSGSTPVYGLQLERRAYGGGTIAVSSPSSPQHSGSTTRCSLRTRLSGCASSCVSHDTRRRIGEKSCAGTPPIIPALYRGAEVFVLTSYAEGLPTVLADAMYACVRILTTGIRGRAKHLTDGEDALFVRPGHPEQIEAALLRFLRDPE